MAINAMTAMTGLLSDQKTSETLPQTPDPRPQISPHHVLISDSWKNYVFSLIEACAGSVDRSPRGIATRGLKNSYTLLDSRFQFIDTFSSSRL